VKQLGLRIASPTSRATCIHESSNTGSARSGARRRLPAVLAVRSGGKFDYTIKWWDHQRYQDVVDHFRDRLLFVQVGENHHNHPAIDGAVDLRGRTSHREPSG
jgi:hypothetical protein